MNGRDRKLVDENIRDKWYFTAKVTYMMGGHNYMHGTMFPRGYYLSVSVVEREQHDGYKVEKVILGNGFKHCLLEAGRFSEKALASVVVPVGLVEQMKARALHQAGLAPTVASP